MVTMFRTANSTLLNCWNYYNVGYDFYYDVFYNKYGPRLWGPLF
jgi:hypothetical protein